MKKEITEKLEKMIKKENIYKNEPMSKHTSFKIGGMADYYLKVETEEELKTLLNLATTEKIPFHIIGNGTNLLVREGGIRGFVIKLELKDYVIGKQHDFAYITVGSRNASCSACFDCAGKWFIWFRMYGRYSRNSWRSNSNECRCFSEKR